MPENTPPLPDWMTVGAKLVLIESSGRSGEVSTVSDVKVERIGKRDIVLNAQPLCGRFTVQCWKPARDVFEQSRAYYGSYTFQHATLAQPTSPIAVEAHRAWARHLAVGAVADAFYAWRGHRGPERAEALKAALDKHTALLEAPQ